MHHRLAEKCNVAYLYFILLTEEKKQMKKEKKERKKTLRRSLPVEGVEWLTAAQNKSERKLRLSEIPDVFAFVL